MNELYKNPKIIENENDILLSLDEVLYLSPPRPDGIELKALLKVKGMILTVHKNDQDGIFPSNPHAHEYDKKWKINLYTGEKFDRDKKLVGKLPSKTVIFIQEELCKRGINFPHLKT